MRSANARVLTVALKYDGLPIIALLVTYFCWLIYFSHSQLSVGYDERAHIAAGVAIHRLGCLDVYAVNGPIVPSLTTLSWARSAEIRGVYSLNRDPQERPEFAAGHELILRNGHTYPSRLIASRRVGMIFGILGIMGCWLFGRAVGGSVAGVWAAGLWCIEPNILGHSSIVGTDIPAAAVGAWIGWGLARFGQSPTLNRVAVCGILIGVGVLIKPLWIVGLAIVPAWGFAVVFFKRGMRWWQALSCVIYSSLLVILTINAGYGFHDCLRPLGEFNFSSPSLSGVPLEQAADLNRLPRSNRFRGSLLHYLPVPVPAAMLLGMDLQATQFARDGLKRERSGVKPFFPNAPNWRKCYSYYLLTFFIKSNLAFILSVCLCAWCILSHSEMRKRCALPALMAVMLSVWVSGAAASDGHYRYAMVILPSLFVMVALAATYSGPRIRVLFVLLLFCSWAESLASYPFGISQVNICFGGLSSSSKVLCGTNVDYGTGWIAASQYCRDHDRIAMIDDPMISMEFEAMGLLPCKSDNPSVKSRLRSADVGGSFSSIEPIRPLIVAGCVRIEPID